MVQITKLHGFRVRLNQRQGLRGFHFILAAGSQAVFRVPKAAEHVQTSPAPPGTPYQGHPKSEAHRFEIVASFKGPLQGTGTLSADSSKKKKI